METGVLFGEIVGKNNAAHLRRRYAENTADTTCYMNVQSSNDELQIGWIFINGDDAPELVRHCIHHEITHVLGAPHHTEWSSYFTHNSKSGPIADTSADFDLLSALYSENITAGDPADEVVKEFEFIINNRE